jgi:hypothetical protein
MPARFRIVVSRGSALRVGSGVAALLACGLLVALAQLESATPTTSEPTVATVTDARAKSPEPERAPRRVNREPDEPMPAMASRPRPAAPRAAARSQAAAPMGRSAPAPSGARSGTASTRPAPIDRREAPTPAAPPPSVETEPPAPAIPSAEADERVASLPAIGDTPPPLADPSAVAVLDRAQRIDELAKQDEIDQARADAEALLAEHASTSGLIDTLARGGADEIEARLVALRALQLGGETASSQDLARELKRSYAGTPEVVKTIERWGMLTPRIVSTESSIADGEVVVTGTVENPDIGEVRSVEIVVEALDAAGNRIATAEARVRPKVLPSGSRGGFEARFKRVDPTTVLRTRSSVLSWRAEVTSAG